jgi:hypothetical protein
MGENESINGDNEREAAFPRIRSQLVKLFPRFIWGYRLRNPSDEKSIQRWTSDKRFQSFSRLCSEERDRKREGKVSEQKPRDTATRRGVDPQDRLLHDCRTKKLQVPPLLFASSKVRFAFGFLRESDASIAYARLCNYRSLFEAYFNLRNLAERDLLGKIADGIVKALATRAARCDLAFSSRY